MSKSVATLSSVSLLPPSIEESNNGKFSGEEINILNQLRPVIRKFVTAVKDYAKFVELAQTYAGKLDPNFVAGMSKILNGIQTNIRVLVGNRWPKATEFLDEKFQLTMVELEDKAKAAIKGHFHKNFSLLFKKMLEHCYTFIKLIRVHFSEAAQPTVSPVVSPRCRLSSPVVSPRNNTSTSNTSIVSPTNISNDSGQKPKERKSGLTLKRTKTTNVKPIAKIQEATTRELPIPQTPSTKWRCFKCTVVNPKGDKCQMCGESKPVMYEMVSSPTSQSHVDDLRVNTKWICSCCKFINPATSPECQMCAQSQTASNNILETGWTCTNCTILNGGAMIKCSSCGLHRNNRGRSSSSPQLFDVKSVASITLNKNPSKRKIVPLSQANLNMKNN